MDENCIVEFDSPIESSTDSARPSSIGSLDGFIELWMLQNEELTLINLIGKHEFSDFLPIKAKWFSGEIQVVLDSSYAKYPVCVGSYYVSGQYNKELKIIFENGRVISKQLIDRTKSSNEKSFIEMDDAVKFFSEKCDLIFEAKKK